MSLIDNIKKSEGFSGTVYKDTLGFLTIGFGTKLPISKEEGELLLKYRLQLMIQELNVAKSETLNKLSVERLDVICEMAYQMGVPGLLRFKNMWIALEKGDYLEASIQMLDSRWAKQTPRRAKKLSEKMKS